MSCKIKGRLVTMPAPLGRKSQPTRFSSTELLPELCNNFKLTEFSLISILFKSPAIRPQLSVAAGWNQPQQC